MCATKPKRTAQRPGTSTVWLSLLLFSVSATSPAAAANMSAPGLPGDVTINKDAGRGSLLLVMIRMDGGEELPFAVDTGSMATVFDKSLEPQLGKRLETAQLWNFGIKHKANLYAPPKLYLASTLLRTGDNVWSTELKQLTSGSGHSIMGILGMDCLRYYCIQLDFEADKMRFLDPAHVDAAQLGNAFPMTLSSLGSNQGEYMLPRIYFGSLIGGEGSNLLADTGCDVDGALESGLFRWQVLTQRLGVKGDVASSHTSGYAWFKKCVWNGTTYTHLFIKDGGTDFSTGNGANLIGLGFLARHLVTFDFPTRTLYLKQTSIGPLVGENMEAAVDFLNNLKEHNQLPGWSNNDKGTIYCRAEYTFANCDGRKHGDASTYHYIVGHSYNDSSWKLRKAWRTNQKDRTVEQYALP